MDHILREEDSLDTLSGQIEQDEVVHANADSLQLSKLEALFLMCSSVFRSLSILAQCLLLNFVMHEMSSIKFCLFLRV